MPVISTMVLNSLIKTGEKIIGGTLDSNEQPYYLGQVNAFLDMLSIERLMTFQLVQESFLLTASTISYTIGPGATFNTVRPTRIVDPCFIRDSDGSDSELTILNDVSYGRIVQKQTSGSYTNYINYNQGYSATSSGTLNFWPGPTSNLTTYINSWKQLGNFSTLTQNVSLPPGYQAMIECNFAVFNAPGLSTISPELVMAAKMTKAAVKTVNLPAPISRLDYWVASGLKTNILTGP